MAGLGDVRRWDPAALEESFGKLTRLRDNLVESGEEFAKALPPASWTGEAADHARAEHTRVAGRVEDVVAEVAAARRATMEAADAVTGLRTAITEAEELARRWDYRLAEDGQVVDTAVAAQTSDPARLEQLRQHAADRARIKAELEDRVTEIVRRANDIDDDLAKVLWRALAGGIDGADATTAAAAAALGDSRGGLSTLEPPRGTPAQNAGWWSSLGTNERQQLLAQLPDWIGNLDGVPAEIRDNANRSRIGGERDRLRTELAALQADPDAAQQSRGSAFGTTRIQEVHAKLASLDAVDKVLAQSGGRQLLVLDTGGPRVKAAVARGDVDTASRIAVFTPGFTSTVDHSLETYDRQMADIRDLAQRKAGPGESVATVTWIGYDAPQINEVTGGNSVAAEHAAREGGAKLAGFLNGIDASRGALHPAPQLTALGHSYGSLTTGHALAHGTGADNAVVYGSPGLGTSTIADLKVPDGHAFNIATGDDPVAQIGDLSRITPGDSGAILAAKAATLPWATDASGWFGINPSRMDGMIQLSTDQATGSDGGPLDASHGHSEYMRDRTTSQDAIANVIAGHPEQAVRRG